jgi:hypothetical protein
MLLPPLNPNGSLLVNSRLTDVPALLGFFQESESVNKCIPCKNGIG